MRAYGLGGRGELGGVAADGIRDRGPRGGASQQCVCAGGGDEVRHRSEAVEYRLEGEDVARSQTQEVHAAPPNAPWSPTDGLQRDTEIREKADRTKEEHGQGRRHDDVPEPPVSDSQRGGRIRLAQFLKEAGISKNTFFLTYRRDAEWMRRLDGHRDSGDRLHFAEGAGHMLREFRDMGPHFNAGRRPGRACAVCTAWVHPRLESCPNCGQSPNKSNG